MACAAAIVLQLGQYKYLDLPINIFVVVPIVSNLVAKKFTQFGPFKISAAQLLFTEVYGYSASRRAIWTGFMGSAVMTAMGMFAIWLPSSPNFKNQTAFEALFGVVRRVVAGSMIAYWVGEFAKSHTVAKMKPLTNGRFLWTRTVGLKKAEGMDFFDRSTNFNPFRLRS